MKVYVVLHETYEYVMAVYSTEEQAIALCERVEEAATRAGWSYPNMVATWDEFEIDPDQVEIKP